MMVRSCVERVTYRYVSYCDGFDIKFYADTE